MVKGLIEHIANDLRHQDYDVFLTENNDGFLYREDVQNALHVAGIDVVNGSKINQRIQFELKDEGAILVLLCKDNSAYLEDIEKRAHVNEFSLNNYFNGYHIPSIVNLELELLDKLFAQKQFVRLNRAETLKLIEKTESQEISFPSKPVFDLDLFDETILKLTNEETINWAVVCRTISKGLAETIDTPEFDPFITTVNKVNVMFQDYIQHSFQQTKNSSAVKKPQIVSKILDHLSFNYLHEKIALIVVDGLAYWQYELLNKILPPNRKENVISSWLPSITQLSRQAIFRGGAPEIDYRQGPVSENKLWKEYWEIKNVSSHKIRYCHNTVDFDNLRDITKFAIVLTDLDERMHNSTDYKDLLHFTQRWIEESGIVEKVEKLQEAGFTIFLTTDHGNIQAKGWRGLKGREKLGTNKSGSRSQRHLEYSDRWLKDEFIDNNPDLKGSITEQEGAIYFNSDLSFSTNDKLVTHGGAHILEVLIPFIEIKNE